MNLRAGQDEWAFIDWDTAAPGSRLAPLLGRRTRAMHDFLRDQAALGQCATGLQRPGEGVQPVDLGETGPVVQRVRGGAVAPGG
jgi:hypothetical protein